MRYLYLTIITHSEAERELKAGLMYVMHE